MAGVRPTPGVSGSAAYVTLTLPVPGQLVCHIHCASHLIPSCRLTGSPWPVSTFPQPAAPPPPLAQTSLPRG